MLLLLLASWLEGGLRSHSGAKTIHLQNGRMVGSPPGNSYYSKGPGVVSTLIDTKYASNMAANAPLYSPLNAQSREIRLRALFPGSPDDPINCHITIHELPAIPSLTTRCPTPGERPRAPLAQRMQCCSTMAILVSSPRCAIFARQKLAGA